MDNGKGMGMFVMNEMLVPVYAILSYPGNWVADSPQLYCSFISLSYFVCQEIANFMKSLYFYFFYKQVVLQAGYLLPQFQGMWMI